MSISAAAATRECSEVNLQSSRYTFAGSAKSGSSADLIMAFHLPTGRTGAEAANQIVSSGNHLGQPGECHWPRSLLGTWTGLPLSRLYILREKFRGLRG